MKYLLVILSIILFGCMRPFVGSYCYLENPSSDGSVKCDWAQTLIMPTIPESRDNKLFHQHPRVMAKSYVGKMKNNDFHGQGKLIFNDGRSYEGDWKDGKILKGTLITQSGTYVGTFITVYDKYRRMIGWLPHGKGTITFNELTGTREGGKYVGEFDNGFAHGQGTRYYEFQSKTSGRVVGTWRKSIAHSTSAVWDAKVYAPDTATSTTSDVFRYECVQAQNKSNGLNCGTIHLNFARKFGKTYILQD
jgi:hypothetical protein